MREVAPGDLVLSFEGARIRATGIARSFAYASPKPAERITGVGRREHLRASHIQPWRDSENDARLDGENGLLLTPTIDHLFDRGFISFGASFYPVGKRIEQLWNVVTKHCALEVNHRGFSLYARLPDANDLPRCSRRKAWVERAIPES
jgi:hypothetical protein